LKREISVVIPNFNGRALLEKNLPSVFAALANIPGNHEVIVADDASKDDSISFLKLNYPQIHLVVHQVNQGFSPNINSGIFVATKELVFALNSDVYLTESYFLPLMNYFDDENTFGVMGRIIDLEGDKTQDAAKYPYQKGFQIKSTLNYTVSENPLAIKIPTFFLSGANALMCRHKLMILKGYNEIYAPFYVEDVDLSLRAWRLGWDCFYEDKAVCRHPVSVTISKYSKRDFVKTISIRNQMLLQELHLEGIELIGWRFQLLLNVCTKWLTFNRPFYKGFVKFLLLYPKMKHSKNTFNKIHNNGHKHIAISQVINNIKKSISSLPISKF
jgi:GT2 family glycosyltransferase